MFKVINTYPVQLKKILNLFIVFAAMSVLLSCADLNFRKDSVQSGLLEIGQIAAQQNCKETGNYQSYQSCIRQVDQNYDNVYK